MTGHIHPPPPPRSYHDISCICSYPYLVELMFAEVKKIDLESIKGKGGDVTDLRGLQNAFDDINDKISFDDEVQWMKLPHWITIQIESRFEIAS